VKKRTALLKRLKVVFRSHRSQPVARVIELINPVLRGWVNYFAHGHASRCFSYIRDWIEKKIRRHLARNSKRSGFGWKRWSRRWLYTHLGLFSGYRVHRSQQKALPVR
jgi:RNA-directed DNA polymerase